MAPLEIRARVGYMPESDAHIPGMKRSLRGYCGELAGLPRADAMQRAHEVLFYVGLGEARYRNVGNLFDRDEAAHQAGAGAGARSGSAVSRRADQRHGPKGRDEMLELVRDLVRDKGINLILSSHLLPDVEYTCDHVDRHGQGTDRGTGTD